MLDLARFYPSLLILSASATAMLAVFTWRQRPSGIAPTGSYIMLTITAWTLTYALELQSLSLETAVFWAKAKNLMVSIIPVIWVIFSLQYAGLDRWHTPRKQALMSLPSVAYAILLATNESHRLVWKSAALIQTGPFLTLDADFGPVFWLFIIYSYTLILLATVVYLHFMSQSHQVYQGYLGTMLAASLPPLLASLHDVFYLPPYPYLDFTPVGFTLTALIVALGIARRKFGSIVPMARGFILEGMDDAVIVLDDQNRIVDLNSVAADLIGAEEPLVMGMPIGKVWPPLEPFLKEPEAADTLEREIDFLHHGQHLYFDMRISILRDDAGNPLGHVVVLREITSRKSAERSLRESEERFALAARGANDGLWDWDLRSNKVYYSSRWISMLDYDEGEIGENPNEWFLRVHPDDRQRLRAELDDHLMRITPHFESEYRILHRDGRYRWMLSRGLAVRDDLGQAYRIAGSQTDITNLKEGEQRLRHEARHDALTGLPNRALFLERLRRAMERGWRQPEDAFAVVFMDLDRFKIVNDSLGHLVGDELLIAVAQRLKNCLREEDAVARLGGDEFVVLLEGIHGVNDALQSADRIQGRLRMPFKINGQTIFTSSSIGIAMSSPAYQKAEEVMRDADIAMYHAKSRGAAGTAVFNAHMHASAVARLDLETSLRRALENEEFLLHYQPIEALRTRRLIGFEALLRWEHPERGLLSPAEFLPVAEETGLIVPIGHWVIKEACRQLRVWHDQFPKSRSLILSINLSGRQLGQPDLLMQIQDALAANRLPASSLRLEMTEGAVMEDPNTASHLLGRLRSMGIQVHIDDFGTGYSSLSILHDFPIDALKIDRSFIRRMDGEAKNVQIVKTILTLARTLGIMVVAEGVETLLQLEQLEELNCTYAQGYMLGEPLRPDEVNDLLMIRPLPAAETTPTADRQGAEP